MRQDKNSLSENKSVTVAFSASVLLLSIAYLVYSMTSSEIFGVLTPDAAASYLPLARQLIASPLLFWQDPMAVTVAPGGYIYMALAGAEPDRIFILNIFITSLSVLLIFDLCRRLGGLTAGLAGAVLYSFSPLLINITTPVLNESPYLFLTTLWLWASVLINDKPERKWPVVIAGLALLFSILTRAIYFYWLFPAIITCFLIFFFSKKMDLKKLALRMLIAHCIAAAGAGAYTLHNWKTHSTPMIATGSGTALYFGSNPVTLGYEPPYFGMVHDEWMVTDKVNSHLTPHNDNRLSSAAKLMLKDMPAQDIAKLYFNKLGAILFFSQANLTNEIINNRTFRIFLILMAIIGFLYSKKKLLIIMLLFIVLYLTAVHIPAMYNQRYSIGALDLPLTLLAALGIAHLVRQRSNKKTITISLLILISGATIGSLHQRYSQPLMPRIDKGISHLALRASLDNIEHEGFSGNPLTDSVTFLEKHATITWNNISNYKRGGTPIISIDVLEMDSNCKKIDLTYTDKEKNIWRQSFKLKRPTAPYKINIGSFMLDNIDKFESQLEMKFKCPINSNLKIKDISLYVSQAGLYYNDLIPIE